MAKRKSKIPGIIFGVVWLAVVGACAFLAVARADQYGGFSIIAVFIAVLMVILFFITVSPAKIQKHPFTERLGNYATGFLIFGAICVLVFHLVKTFARTGFIGNIVVVFFIVVFIRILVDFIRDAGKRKRKAGEGPSKGEPPEAGPGPQARKDDEP